MAKRYSKEELKFIKDNYFEIGPKGCGFKLKRSIDSIRILAKKLNLIHKDYKLDHLNVDPKHFEKVQLPEVAYFLGYLWADGYIHHIGGRSKCSYRIEISINEMDAEHLKNIINVTGKWNGYIRKRKRYNIDVQTSITIQTHNKRIYNLLYNLGYNEKSILSPTKILNHIPKNLHPAFWLGYFDGDGYIFVSNNGMHWGLAGSFDQNWEDLFKLFKEIDVTYRYDKNINKKGHKSSAVISSNYFSANNFYKYIKDFQYLGLDRKMKKFKYVNEKFNKSERLQKYCEAVRDV